MNTPFDAKNHLHNELEQIDKFIRAQPGREGIPRLVYKDDYDIFQMTLQKTTAGYDVGCFLNNEPSYQLKGRFFGVHTKLGDVMMIAANAPKNATIDEFFKD